MSASGLIILSNDELVERGAALELERERLSSEFQTATQRINARRQRLIKPGIKLGINAAIGVTGLVLAPFTLTFALLLTAVSIVMLLWDGIDYASDAAAFSTAWLQVRQRRRRAVAIARELNEIETLLTVRLGPP